MHLFPFFFFTHKVMLSCPVNDGSVALVFFVALVLSCPHLYSLLAPLCCTIVPPESNFMSLCSVCTCLKQQNTYLTQSYWCNVMVHITDYKSPSGRFRADRPVRRAEVVWQVGFRLKSNLFGVTLMSEKIFYTAELQPLIFSSHKPSAGSSLQFQCWSMLYGFLGFLILLNRLHLEQ